jgi:hypothetical protein
LGGSDPEYKGGMTAETKIKHAYFAVFVIHVMSIMMSLSPKQPITSTPFLSHRQAVHSFFVLFDVFLSLSTDFSY